MDKVKFLKNIEVPSLVIGNSNLSELNLRRILEQLGEAPTLNNWYYCNEVFTFEENFSIVIPFTSNGENFNKISFYIEEQESEDGIYTEKNYYILYDDEIVGSYLSNNHGQGDGWDKEEYQFIYFNKAQVTEKEYNFLNSVFSSNYFIGEESWLMNETMPQYTDTRNTITLINLNQGTMISNNYNFSRIENYGAPAANDYYYDNLKVYTDDNWINETYRTISFSADASLSVSEYIRLQGIATKIL